MMEELEEAEVIWSEKWSGDVERPIHIRRRESPLRSTSTRRFRRQRGEYSDPVRIPTCRPFEAGADAVLYREEEYEEEEAGNAEMVPPHLMIARRVERKTTSFSVCTGSGRTLKGRDLSRLRNSVLRMTGFLEA